LDLDIGSKSTVKGCLPESNILSLLNMNQHQNIFEFQIVDLTEIPKKDNGKDLFDWLDNFAQYSILSINYWIAITSEPIPKKPS
jgi:hypothetical protein